MENKVINNDTLAVVEVLKDLEKVRESLRDIIEERYGVKKVEDMMEEWFDGPYKELRDEIVHLLSDVIDSNLLSSNYQEF